MTRRLLIWFWNQPKETFLNVHSSTRICRGRGATAPPRQDNKYTHHLEALQPTLLFPSRRCRGPASPSPGRRAGMTGRLPRQSQTQLLATAVPRSPPGTEGPPLLQEVAVDTQALLGSELPLSRPPSQHPLPLCVCVFVTTNLMDIFSPVEVLQRMAKNFQSHSCS